MVMFGANITKNIYLCHIDLVKNIGLLIIPLLNGVEPAANSKACWEWVQKNTRSAAGIFISRVFNVHAIHA